LAVIGIISVSILMSVMNPYKAVRVEAAAKKVAADIQFAQNLAVSTSKWYGIKFEADPVNAYTIYETDGTTDQVIEDPAHAGKDFVVNLSDYYDGVKILGVDIGSGGKIEFHPLGIPYNDKTGSEIALTGVVSVGASGKTKFIHIIPNTGRTSIP
jgi:hypothetical protein